jgi:UDP-glucose 4-epimerase
MRVVVTGGAGYIGTELVTQLAANENMKEIIVYDNLSRGNYNLFLDYKFGNHEKVKLIRGDILDTRLLNKTLEGADVVYHLAANVTTPFANTDPHFYEQVNHWGTAELAYAAEKAKVKKLIFTSSTSVYGSSQEVVDENTDTTPRTFYGISKLRAEQHLESLLNKMEVYMIRCGNVYGYSHSMRFDAVINKFAFEANFYNRISIQGNGRQTRSFIHVDSASQVLAKLADSTMPSGKYNLVEENYQILDIVESLKQVKPDLEFIFVDQHLNLRTMKVSPDLVLKKYVDFPDQNPITEQLREFMDHFSFSSGN